MLPFLEPFDEDELKPKATLGQRARLLAATAARGAVARIPGGETGRKALVWAVIAHVAALIVFALVTVLPGGKEAPEIIAETVVPERIPDLRMQRLSAVKQLSQARPSASASVSRMLRASASAVVAAPETPVQSQAPLGLGTGDLGAGFGAGAAGGGGGGMNPSRIPAAIRGRCIPGERARLLHENGGTPEVEESVVRGLKWLAADQNPDGSWGLDYKGAMTGFALLCFLGRCETPASPLYGETVAKGLLALIAMSQRNQGRIGGLGNNHWSYEHGIAAYALGEAIALMRQSGEKMPGLEEAYLAAVEVIIKGQTSDGGWVYAYASEGAGDLSVTGWQYQALRTARYTGLAPEGLASAISRAAAFIGRRQGPRGGFGYRSVQDRHSLTGVGLLGLQMLGGGSGARMKKGFDFYFAEGPFTYQSPSCDLYSWYYITQAAFNAGGETWQHWNAIFRDQLVEAQNDRGFWPQEGSGRTDQARGDSNLYRACLCLLMLETYYRYLPATG